jgi:hypothetical protein
MDAFQKFSKKPLTPKDFNCDRVVDKMQGMSGMCFAIINKGAEKLPD